MYEIFSSAAATEFSRGQIIATNQKDINRIDSGYIGMYSTVDGIRRLLFVYKTGDVFPLADSSMIHLNRDYSYIALSRVTIRSITRKAFSTHLLSPEIAASLIINFQEIIQLQFERIDNLQKGQTLERLVERLLFFTKRIGIQKEHSIVFDVAMSHVDLATSIGTTRETVNRYMKQLEALGILSVKNQKITIHSVEQLRQIARSKQLPTRRSWRLLPAAAITAAFTIEGVGDIVSSIVL